MRQGECHDAKVVASVTKTEVDPVAFVAIDITRLLASRRTVPIAPNPWTKEPSKFNLTELTEGGNHLTY